MRQHAIVMSGHNQQPVTPESCECSWRRVKLTRASASIAQDQVTTFCLLGRRFAAHRRSSRTPAFAREDKIRDKAFEYSKVTILFVGSSPRVIAAFGLKFGLEVSKELDRGKSQKYNCSAW